MIIMLILVFLVYVVVPIVALVLEKPTSDFNEDFLIGNDNYFIDEIKFKKLNKGAFTPTKADSGSNGFDLTAISKKETENYIEYDTGIAFEVPVGYVGLLFPRSSVSNTQLVLANSVGVLDSSYRGSARFRFKKIYGTGNIYEVGDRIGQIVFIPSPNFELQEVEELSETERGDGGFGASGK